MQTKQQDKTIEDIVTEAAKDTVAKLGQTKKRKDREGLIANLVRSSISFGIEFAVKNTEMFNTENTATEAEAINETA